MEVIPDELPQIEEVLERWIGKTDILVLSGGLGPTHDDKTRFALAEYLGCSLAVDNALYDRVSARYEGSPLRSTVESSRSIQGLVPMAAEGVYNPAGSALGIYFEKNGTRVWSFPGVPFEYKAMAIQELTPLLSSNPGTWTWKSVSIADVPESAAALEVREVVADSRLHISILPSFGLVEFVIRGERELVESAVREIHSKFPENALPDGCSTLPEAILAVGREKGLTLSCAESCTGGALGASLTDLPGISDVFMGSAVVYNNEAKIELLGVEQSVLEAHGAVSKECAESMAKGALQLYGTSLSIAVTGIAGPGGGSAEKPVGTVWFAIASQVGNKTECTSFMRRLSGERSPVRERAVRVALSSVWRKMEEMSSHTPGFP